MDNVINPTLQILPSITVDNKPLMIEVVNLPGNIKVGDMMFLEVLQESGSLKLNAISNGLKIPMQLEGELPLKPQELQNYALKVVSDNTLQLVKNPLPQQPDNTRNVAIVKETNVSLPQIKTIPLQGEQLVQQVISELKLPPQLEMRVAKMVPEALVSVKIENQIPNNQQITEQILHPLKAALQNLTTAIVRQDSPQIAEAQQQIVKVFQDLNTQKFMATPSPESTPNEIRSLNSPLGKIALELPLKMPVDSHFEMSVRTVQTSRAPNAFEPLQVLEKLFVALEAAKVFPKVDFGHLQHLVHTKDEGVINLLKIFEPLQTSPELTQQVLQKLPTLGPKMLANMVSFYKGAEAQEVRNWLGQELTIALQNSGEKGAVALNNLQEMVSQSFKETPSWRMIEIPFFDGSQMIPFKLAVKKDSEQDKEKDKKSKGGVRFVIETDFSKLGAFQLDGFSVVKERRLDLIIRTSRMQSEDFCSHLMNLFKTSLYHVDYIGTIAINQKQSFLRIEDKADSLPEGVFI